MKFLLVAVNAKYIHSNPAIYSLRAFAGKAAAEKVELAEYTVNQHVQEILADVYARRPDAVGFSCYVWNWTLIRELLAELPKLLPHTEVWLGGPEVSFDAERILKDHPALTGIMVGEGEATFRDLLEYYLDREAAASGADVPKVEVLAADVPEVEVLAADVPTAGEPAADVPSAEVSKKKVMQEKLQNIPGLCLRTGYTAMRDPVDVSHVPFLYDDLAPFENRIVYYETSRGCPYRCSYCLSSVEKRVRFRDVDVVKRELQSFLDRRVKQVKFVDRTFNCDHERAVAVWRYLKEHDNGVTNFHFEISADILREDEIDLLRSLRPGQVQLEIGVQSVNPEALRAVRREMNLERLEAAVAALRRGRNVHLHLDLIAGLPYEGYASFGASFDRVYAMRPEQLQLGFLKVLKGSPLREQAEAYGIRSLDAPPYEVLYTNWLSYEEIRKLKAIEEMVGLYYNSGQFTRTLPVLERAFESPFAMYEKLASFYGEKGYFTNSPARIYRYQILLHFAEEWDGARLPIYRELLTFDLYLRENVKSRPDFAADLSLFGEGIRRFYRREEAERRYLPGYEGWGWKELGRMTHLEPFRYPVWDEERLMEAVSLCTPEEVVSFRTPERPEEAVSSRTPESHDAAAGFVLFDYRSRNPLNAEAATRYIPLEEMEALGGCSHTSASIWRPRG